MIAISFICSTNSKQEQPKQKMKEGGGRQGGTPPMKK